MKNPLYQQYGNTANQQISQMRREYEAFRQRMQGDPRQIIMQALQSGQITQAQLNQAQDAARRLQGIL